MHQHDVRVEELIADNIAIIDEAVQGRSKLSFPSTIFRLCKEVGVSLAEFKGTESIPVARPITAKIRKEKGDLAKEIEEIKKFQVNQTLMGFRSDLLDKMEERIHETRNEIIEMRGQIKEWTKNALQERHTTTGHINKAIQTLSQFQHVRLQNLSMTMLQRIGTFSMEL
ncbi:hypothetical protein PIB30_081782 [Stylosanthes scabra]|uniref:Uncharacterized protein n=1 Tax=Stylosanthes scabra TaxID=79078 RepID=A0ABU6UUG5_9FABA|nr:hypothetical protein [Stylosanthes scabra]